MSQKPTRARAFRQDLTGKRFDRLVVVAKSDRTDDGRTFPFWRCRCDCGTVKDVDGAALRAGLTKSCGCARAARFRKDGLATAYQGEYRVWQQAIQRCTNPNAQRYDRYGARGIKVCERWRESFANFLADMGPRPGPGYSLDRIDNDGDYAPENCRWATRVQQMRNTSKNNVIELDGQRKTATEWAAETGISADAIGSRIANGWPAAEALTTPPGELVKKRRRRDDGTFLPR